jgi:hypothetical protein
MAKGQKRSSREPKKPKQPKAKTIAAASPFAAARAQAAPTPAKKG